MSRHPSIYLGLASTLALAGCGQDTPTQPSTSADPDHTVSSLATASNTWAPIAPMPGTGGSGPAIGVVPNSGGLSKAYVFGGTNGEGGSGVGVRIYDVATNTWSLTKDPTADQVYVFNTNGVGNIGDKLYFSGGYDYGSGTALIQSQVW